MAKGALCRSMVSSTELSHSEFFALTEFPGESSVSSSQRLICVPKRTHRDSCRTPRVWRQSSSSSLFQNSSMLIRLPLPQCFCPRERFFSDHGPRKTRTKTQTTPDSVFIGESEKLRPWSEFLGREKLRPWSEFSGVFGVGVDEGALNSALFPTLKSALVAGAFSAGSGRL